MNENDRNRYLSIINKNNSKNESKFRKYCKWFLIRTLFVIVILLSMAILCKSNASIKEKIKINVFTESAAFAKMKKLYDKYLGGILPLKKEAKVKQVFDEKIKYTNISKYYDGFNLSVDENYLVPSIGEGMVVFIGEKDNYGKTIIIDGLDGTQIWYGNIANTSLKIYDYIETGAYIGEANNNLYLVFNKDNKFLSYDEYI